MEEKNEAGSNIEDEVEYCSEWVKKLERVKARVEIWERIRMQLAVAGNRERVAAEGILEERLSWLDKAGRPDPSDRDFDLHHLATEALHHLEAKKEFNRQAREKQETKLTTVQEKPVRAVSVKAWITEEKKRLKQSEEIKKELERLAKVAEELLAETEAMSGLISWLAA